MAPHGVISDTALLLLQTFDHREKGLFVIRHRALAGRRT